jgi:hypothetical protein
MEDKRELNRCSQRGCGFNESIRIKIGVWLIQINIEHFIIHYPLSIHVFSHLFSMIAIDRELLTSTLDSVFAATNTDVDATLRRRRNTGAPIDMSLSFRVRQKLWLRKEAGTRQDRHLIDTDKSEQCH